VRHSRRDADDTVGVDIHDIVADLNGEASLGDDPRFLHWMRVRGYLGPFLQANFIDEE